MLYESYVYKIAHAFLLFLGRGWDESFTARFLRKCSAFFKNIFAGSRIAGIIAREGVLSRTFADSAAYRLLEGLLNIPQRLLHPLFKRAEPALKESVLFKLLLLAVDKIHLLTAAFLFIMLVFPHQSGRFQWNNLYSTVAMAALLLLYLLKTVINGDLGFKPSMLNVFLILFLVCVMLSEVFSIIPGDSFRFFVFYLTCFIMILLLVATVRSKEDLSEVLAIVLLGMSLSGLYGIYQNYKGVPVNTAWIDPTLNQGSLSRVYSVYDNPNNFAEIIVMLLPFYFAAAFNTKSFLKKLVYLALAVPPLLSLVYTQARGAWIGFAVAGFMFVLFKEKRLIPVFAVLGIISVPLLPQSVILRLRTIMNPADTSMQVRFQMYQTVWPIIKDYWFTGLGLGNGTLLRVIRNYYSFLPQNTMLAHSHDLYFQLLLETGAAGVLSFFAFLGSLAKKSIKVITGLRNSYSGNILIAGLSSLCGVLVIGVVEYVWFYPRVMLVFWLVAGLMLAALGLGIKSREA